MLPKLIICVSDKYLILHEKSEMNQNLMVSTELVPAFSKIRFPNLALKVKFIDLKCVPYIDKNKSLQITISINFQVATGKHSPVL